MMAQANNGAIPIIKLVLSLVVFGTLLYLMHDTLLAEDTTGKEDLKNSTVGMVNDVISGESDTLGDVSCPPSQTALEEEIREQAEKNDISPDFAVAIAEVESDIRHCDEDGLIVNEVSEDSLGVMQIIKATAEGVCPGANIKDWEENVACGIAVIKEKQALVDDDNTYLGQVQGCEEYGYDDYVGDLQKKTARAYNGFGCGDGADTEYVDNVTDAMEAQR